MFDTIKKIAVSNDHYIVYINFNYLFVINDIVSFNMKITP